MEINRARLRAMLKCIAMLDKGNQNFLFAGGCLYVTNGYYGARFNLRDVLGDAEDRYVPVDRVKAWLKEAPRDACLDVRELYEFGLGNNSFMSPMKFQTSSYDAALARLSLENLGASKRPAFNSEYMMTLMGMAGTGYLYYLNFGPNKPILITDYPAAQDELTNANSIYLLALCSNDITIRGENDV